MSVVTEAAHPIFHRRFRAPRAFCACMRTLLVLSTALSALAVAAPASAAPDLPPTDPVRFEGTGCSPDYPCTIQPQLVVDKTYPSRVVAWAKDVG